MNTYWRDSDGDGFGDRTMPQVNCMQPLGYVANDDDCDDRSAGNRPGAQERCDGDDNDCDGIVPTDELDPDGDGLSACNGDCDPARATVRPGLPEICDGLDNDCDRVVPPNESDADGDGHRICEGDCNDGNATIFPNGPELCDGLDNNCDQTVPVIEIDDDNDGASECQGDCDDGDPSLNLRDVDGDGVTTCAMDCDDTRADRSPMLTEICDGVDNDCRDGIPADELIDLDGDGALACIDCNDTSSTAYPGAPELCNRRDDDCDSVVPRDEMDLDGDFATGCEGDCDDNDASRNILDVDGDGFTTCSGDCVDTSTLAFPGAPELCDDTDNDCDGTEDDNIVSFLGGGTCSISEASLVITGDNLRAQLGRSLATRGDVNGDGLDDLIIGAPLGNLGAPASGLVYVFFGTTPRRTGTAPASSADRIIIGEASGDRAGTTVAYAGDIDGDGTDDILIGAPGNDGGGSEAGRVYVVFGSSIVARGMLTPLGMADYAVSGEQDQQIGRMLTSLGDIDDDQRPEFAFAGPVSGTTGSRLLYVTFGGDVTPNGSASTLSLFRLPGRNITGLGDVGGSSVSDFIVESHTVAGVGMRTQLFFGDAGSGVGVPDLTFDWTTGEPFRTGDVDGDGLSDVVFGNGIVLLARFLPPTGPVTRVETIGLPVSPRSAAGDLDRDGLDDIVSARGIGGTRTNNEVHVFLGNTISSRAPGGSVALRDAALILTGEAATDEFGDAVSGGGDIDGDGVPDLVMSAPSDDSAGQNVGKVYIIYGNRW